MNIFLDTETTGLSRKSRIVEFAIIVQNAETEEVVYTGSTLVNPGIPIPKEASDIHGIDDCKVKDAIELKDTDVYKMFEKYNTEENCTIIHNSQFDLTMLYYHGVVINTQLIDSLTCARSLFPKFKNHKLNDLVQGCEQDHRALSDCHMVMKLMNDMLLFKSKQDLIELTKVSVMAFGKYKGFPVHEVDHGYLKWMVEKMKGLDYATKILIKSIAFSELMTEDDFTYLKAIRLNSEK